LTFKAPLAYLSVNRDVWTIDAEGKHRSHTEIDVDALMLGSWQTGPKRTGTFSWPTWSPNGDQVACFKLADAHHDTSRVFVCDVDGVNQTELMDLGKRLPIYLFWSPNSKHIAMLSQGDDKLMLSTGRPDRAGTEITLAEGSPLFFTWAGSGQVAAFIGGTNDARTSRLVLMDPKGTGNTTLLPGNPGSFCAPVCIDGNLFYVSHERGNTSFVTARSGAAESTWIDDVDGLVAMVASPDGKTLARAVASSGDGTPYHSLSLVDIETLQTRPLWEQSCLAFAWTPNGKAIVAAQVDTTRNLLQWYRIDLDGRHELLVSMYPTRDLGFYLRFFEQYTQSHSLMNPDGTHIVLPGGIHGHTEAQGASRLWAIPLDGSDRPRELGQGLFAVFGPKSKPADPS